LFHFNLLHQCTPVQNLKKWEKTNLIYYNSRLNKCINMRSKMNTWKKIDYFWLVCHLSSDTWSTTGSSSSRWDYKSKKLTNHSRLFFSHSTVSQFLTLIVHPLLLYRSRMKLKFAWYKSFIVYMSSIQQTLIIWTYDIGFVKLKLKALENNL